MKYVTLEQARAHLRSDNADDDNDLDLKISAASAAVKRYITVSQWEPYRDENGDPYLDSFGDEIPVDDSAGKQIRPEIQHATLLQVAYLYRERDGSQEYAVPTQWGYGYALCQGAIAMLYDLRVPTVG